MYLVAGIAAVAVLAETITVVFFTRAQRALSRESARERERLTNQLCNLAGKPWLPAPADDYEAPDPEPILELVAAPEQLPDY